MIVPIGEVEHMFEPFYVMAKTQFLEKTQIFRSDNDRELFSDQLGNFFTSKKIVHKSSCSDTPQQNGVVEEKNRPYGSN